MKSLLDGVLYKQFYVQAFSLSLHQTLSGYFVGQQRNNTIQSGFHPLSVCVFVCIFFDRYIIYQNQKRYNNEK